MINTHILKKTIRSNWVLLFIGALVPLVLAMIMIFAIPSGKDGVKGIQGVLDAMFFGSMGFEVPLIFTIVVGNKLVVSEVQKGEMVYLVASPIKRRKIIATKIFFSITANALFFLFEAIILVPLVADQKTDTSAGIIAWQLFGLTTLLFASGGIIFLTSTYFDKIMWSWIVGGGLLLFFFLATMISGISSSMEWLKYFSIDSLFKSENFYKVIDQGTGKTAINSLHISPSAIGGMIALVIIGSGCYIASNIIFVKKDLPL